MPKNLDEAVAKLTLVMAILGVLQLAATAISLGNSREEKFIYGIIALAFGWFLFYSVLKEKL